MADSKAIQPRGFVSPVDDSRPRLPGSMHSNRKLSQWISFKPAKRICIHTGKVEIGQGILTALRLIAAEELDVPPEFIEMVTASTSQGPDEGVTSGSLSIQHSGMAIRHACAAVRHIALVRATEKAQAPTPPLRIHNGNVCDHAGRFLGDYWSLLTEQDLEAEPPADARHKSIHEFSLLGREDTPRLDLPDKVFGVPRFVHDLRLPGMVHGRIVRPPSPTAQLAWAPTSDVEAMEHVIKVVIDGRFIGVLAANEPVAIAAATRLARDCTWREQPMLPAQSDLARFLEAAPATTSVVHEVIGGLDSAGATKHCADYLKPYLAHASIGPSCAVARFKEHASLELWTHSQSIFNLRDDVFLALRESATPVAKEAILIHHVEGAGCYGHNGADDAAFDAVMLALQVPGNPVRVQWSRADELAAGPLGPAQLARLSAWTDSTGSISAWSHEIWANGYSTRPGRATVPALLAASHRQSGEPIPVAINAPLALGGGSDRNSVPLYAIPSVKVINHRLDVMPIRTSAMRALGAYSNVFAIESFIDETAHAIGVDPIELRKKHLRDPRALAVMDTVIERCNWWDRPAEPAQEGIGKGFAVARYKNSGAWCAVAARIEASEHVRVLNLDIAVDAGQVIDLDGVRNQIEGGAIQSVSWTLKEQVTFDTTRITSNEWAAYPILRFPEVPEVSVHVIDRPGHPPVGAGEAAQGPVAAAIGNALFNAIGVRVRTLPLNIDNVMAAME